LNVPESTIGRESDAVLHTLAGPEIGGGNFLSDTSPEEKAAELRAAGGPHYSTAHD
jgi:UDPglucose--hexose-1-phosphate uridylyltransferase